MRHAPARARMRGLTLVELAIAVSIAGVVMLGAAALGAQAWADYRADRFAERLVSLVDQVDGVYTVRNDYVGLSTASAGSLGLLRYESVAGQHLYGGSMTLGVLVGAGFNNQAWGVYYADVPVEACLTVLRTALAVGDAVALRPGVGGAFDDWGPGLTKVGADVLTFPNGYRVVKNRRDVVPTVLQQINACDAVTGVNRNTPFGLAVVRSKL